MSSDSINDKNISIEELEKLLFNLKNRSKNTPSRKSKSWDSVSTLTDPKITNRDG